MFNSVRPCPITRNPCESGCAWNVGGACAVAKVAAALAGSGHSERDESDYEIKLMEAASAEHTRACGRFRELQAKGD